MMDLVILGIFAFWIGKNFDGFDLDFSQNQDSTTENPPENLPAKFTEWTMIREQLNRFGSTCSLWKRQYKQGKEVLFSQYQIRVEERVLRSGYRDEEEALAEFEKTVRPYRDGELEDLQELQEEKDLQNSPQKEEREPAQPLTFEDYTSSKGGVF
jgi:hypothetical protein